MPKNTKLIIALSLIPQIILIKFISNYPEFIEVYYSNGVYQFISKIFRYILGWIPFSFGDIIYTLASIYVLRWLYVNRKRFRKEFKRMLIEVIAVISICYFSFHMLWGLNYYRQPLHKNLNIQADYTTEQLIKVTETLINKSNNLHAHITNNDTLKIDLPYSKKDI